MTIEKKRENEYNKSALTCYCRLTALFPRISKTQVNVHIYLGIGSYTNTEINI